MPKPIMQIESKTDESKDNSIKKKAYKKLNFINIKDFDKFVNGNFDNPIDTNNIFKKFGKKDILTKANIKNGITKPYRVGVFRYSEKSGLYVVVVYNDENVFNDVYKTIQMIGWTGIGGKKSSGLGKFNIEIADENEYVYKFFDNKLKKENKKYITISICLPKDEELEKSIENATYTIIRKGGFVDTVYNSIEKIKKREIYLFKSGSCFENKFEGDLYNVSFDDNNKIYKYAKPLWIGV